MSLRNRKNGVLRFILKLEVNKLRGGIWLSRMIMTNMPQYSGQRMYHGFDTKKVATPFSPARCSQERTQMVRISESAREVVEGAIDTIDFTTWGISKKLKASVPMRAVMCHPSATVRALKKIHARVAQKNMTRVCHTWWSLGTCTRPIFSVKRVRAFLCCGTDDDISAEESAEDAECPIGTMPETGHQKSEQNRYIDAGRCDLFLCKDKRIVEIIAEPGRKAKYAIGATTRPSNGKKTAGQSSP